MTLLDFPFLYDENHQLIPSWQDVDMAVDKCILGFPVWVTLFIF